MILPVTYVIEEGEEEVSDSETTEARPKLLRTDRASNNTESPQLLEAPRGLDGGGAGLTESQPLPLAPPERHASARDCSGDRQGGKGGVEGINILSAPFSL